MGSVVYRPVRSDLLAASRLHHFASITSRPVVTGACVYALAIGSLGFFIMRPSSTAPFIGAIMAAMALGFVIAALTLKQMIVPRYVVRRQLREQRSMREEYTFSWNDNGYTARGATGSSDLPWSHYVSWRENAHVLLLYRSWQSYQFVPKRILPPGAADEVRGNLRTAGVVRARKFLS